MLRAPENRISDFEWRGIVIRMVISNFTFDGTTKDPMQQKAISDAPIGLYGHNGRAQAESTKLAMRAGIEGPRPKTSSATAASPDTIWAGSPASPASSSTWSVPFSTRTPASASRKARRRLLPDVLSHQS